MKIAVMGAGGIGGYVGGRLAQAGMDVTLIARGAHLEALRERGLTLDLPDGQEIVSQVRAVASPTEAGPADLILFTVKLSDAEAAAAALAPMIGPETRIVTLQNGIDSQAILERHVGPGRVAAGIIYLAAYIRAPGVIWHPGGVHRTVVDRMEGDAVMAKLLATNPLLTDLDILPTDDPRRTVWEKFVNLAAFSAITGLARSPIGRIYEHPETLAAYAQLMAENLAVAMAEGLAFPEEHVEKTIELFRNQPYEQKSSMLVDLEAGKPIELPWLSGRIAELADQHGLDVPMNRAVVAALAPFVSGTPAR